MLIKDKIIYGCKKLVEYGIYLLIFLSPLVFCPFTFSTFELPKITLIRTITILLLAAGIIKVVLLGELTIRRTPLDIPIFCFAFSIFISALFSINTSYALFGYYGYFEGLLTFLNYFLIYFILVNVIKEEKQINKIISLIIGSATVVAIYGLLQASGIEIISDWKVITKLRIISTLGNPMLLGGYLVGVIPLVVGRIFAFSRGIKLFYFVIFSVIFSTLLLTFTRGAYLAFVLSLGVIFVSKASSKYKKEILTLFLVVLFIFFIFHQKKTIISEKEIILIDRINPAGTMHSASVKIRGILWEDTLEIIRKNPGGVGPDNFPLAYDKHSSKRLPKISGLSLASAEKAHNEFLQITSVFGFFGLWCYLWIWCCLLLFLRKNKSLWQAILFSFFAAYLIQSQFSYNTSAISLNFWYLVGISISLGYLKDPSSVVKLSFRKKHLVVIFTLSLLIIFFFARLVIFNFLSDMNFGKGIKLFSEKKWEDAEKELKKAISLFPFEENYYNNLGITYTQMKKYNLAIKEFEKARDINPQNALVWNNIGLAYLNTGEIEKALSAFYKGKKIAPHLPEIYFNLGDIWSRKGQIEKAIAEYQNGLKIFPSDAQGNFNLGELYYKKGDFKKSIFYYQRVVKNSPPSARAYNNLGMALVKVGKFQEAIDKFEYALELETSSVEIYINLGFAYFRQGKLDKAEEYIKKALLISPHHKTANYALSQIREKAKK